MSVIVQCADCGTVFYEKTQEEYDLTGKPLLTDCHKCGFRGPPIAKRFPEVTKDDR